MTVQELARQIGNRPAFSGGMTLRQYYLGNFPDMATVDMMLEQLARVEMEHECKYCGVMTTQPDELCYKAPAKTGWEDAPEWANWKAMDEDATWSCFEKKPIILEQFWGHMEGYKYGILHNHPPTSKHWTETLEERPKP